MKTIYNAEVVYEAGKDICSYSTLVHSREKEFLMRIPSTCIEEEIYSVQTLHPHVRVLPSPQTTVPMRHHENESH